MKNERISAVMAELDREFDKQALDWLVSMYDAKSGGMYYSASSRDNEQFEPDIESTTQTISLLQNLGLIRRDENGAWDIPEWFAEGAIKFLQSRQNESDGYFYDPIYKEIGKKPKRSATPISPLKLLQRLARPRFIQRPFREYLGPWIMMIRISPCMPQKKDLSSGLTI